MKTPQTHLGIGIGWKGIGRGRTITIGTAGLAILALGTVLALGSGPSAFPHTVDGAFTAGGEWSDVPGLEFFVPSDNIGATVYTDQNQGKTALFLMYDVHGRGPLGMNEPFIVQFDVVEGGVFEHYEVRVFGDSSTEVLVDGAPSPPEGIMGAAGVGGDGITVPFHPLVELSVPLNTVYSPDTPLFWSASVDSRKPQGTGDPVVSALLTFAGSDGTTTVVPVGTPTPFGIDPSDVMDLDLADLCDIVGDMIDLVVPTTGTYKNHGDYVNKVLKQTKMSVASCVNSGVITAAEGGKVQGCVVSERAKRKVP